MTHLPPPLTAAATKAFKLQVLGGRWQVSKIHSSRCQYAAKSEKKKKVILSQYRGKVVSKQLKFQIDISAQTRGGKRAQQHTWRVICSCVITSISWVQSGSSHWAEPRKNQPITAF